MLLLVSICLCDIFLMFHMCAGCGHETEIKMMGSAYLIKDGCKYIHIRYLYGVHRYI